MLFRWRSWTAMLFCFWTLSGVHVLDLSDDLLDSSPIGAPNAGDDSSEFLRQQIVYPLLLNSSSDRYYYRFNAFNHTFLLLLTPDSRFLTANFRVDILNSIGENSTLDIVNEDIQRHCFHVGHVVGDDESRASISLCRGHLYGLIHTSFGDFTIDKFYEEEDSERPSHLISQINDLRLTAQTPNNGTLAGRRTTTCGVNDSQRESPRKHKRRKKKKVEDEEESGGSRGKRSVSHERHLEVMVAVDSKMVRYHGENLRHYILTLMSTVAYIYRDPSIGNDINIAVVKLVQLDEQEDRDIIFSSAAKTLTSFCKWQHLHNDYDDSHPQHHDVAILLTREDLCRIPKTCDTLGLAQSGMVCDRYNSCAIVEDNGLSAAFTIVHELGHVLSIPHDDDRKCARYQGDGQRLHVMARMLDFNSHPWSWSLCSRHYTTNFFDSGSAYCLLDKPSQDLLQVVPYEKFPGEHYDMDKQCSLVYGRGSKICTHMPVCKRLWCTAEDMAHSGCKTQHMPWADGTSCGRGNWCQEGECVPIHHVKKHPIDGNWSQWSTFGQCSRSCGGGVRRSIRECDNPRPSGGGHYCRGRRMQFQSCNIHDCPRNTVDFREEQCGAFNGKTFNFAGLSNNVKWMPQLTGIPPSDLCKLYCQVKGGGAYYLLKDKVIDGTSCTADSNDLCVNGICMKAGCDRHLESGKVPDSCGVCGGDNSTCKVVTGHFNTINYGYNPVVVIPAGATNIDIRQYGYQNSKDDNYLALMNKQNDYLLNGQFIVSMFPKTVPYDGVQLDYTGSHVVMERINTTKPLRQELYVQVLTVGELSPPDIKFQYTVTTSDASKYMWEREKKWTACNRVCQGEQFKEVVCVRRPDKLSVSEAHCREEERPDREAQVCNLHCELRWRIAQTSQCSSACGPGTRQRMIQCTQQFNNHKLYPLSDQFCSHLGPKPPEFEECQGSCPASRWEYGEWSQCSKSCGGGSQFRSAHCVNDQGHKGDDSHCSQDQLVTSQSCNTGECPRWEVANWTECSVTCGSGEKQRPYWCQEGDKQVSRVFCDPDTIPAHKELCHIQCYHWHTGHWSACSEPCGDGFQLRSVQCRSSQGVSTADHLCESNDRPADEVSCNRGPCPTPSTVYFSTPPPLKELNNNNIHQEPTTFVRASLPAPQTSGEYLLANWRTGDWGPCSKTCGEGGVHSRQVHCAHAETILTDDHCLHHVTGTIRPTEVEPCPRQDPCGRWRSGNWSPCPVTCGQGTITRYVACVSAEEGTILEERFCGRDEKPHRETQCPNLETCPTETLPAPLPITQSWLQTEGGYGPQWRVGQWGECSRSCGGGLKRRQVACFGEPCSGSTDSKPPDHMPCNEEPCTRWDVGNWAKCNSKGCGVEGHQNRTVHCLEFRGQKVLDALCEGHDDKPQSTRTCEEPCEPPFHRWYLGPYGKCCKGTRRRQVLCLDEREKSVPTARCDGTPPENRQACATEDAGDCPKWDMLDEWSPCSGVCLNASESQSVACRAGQSSVDEDLCEEPKPVPPTRACLLKGCSYVWDKRGPWSKCNATCGRGVRKRKTPCIEVKAKVEVNEKYCSGLKEPKTVKRCRAKGCPFNWVTGHWAECSRPCGHGTQNRSVSCHRTNGYGWEDPRPASPSRIWCNVTERPHSTRSCNFGSCHGRGIWKPGPWKSCSVKCGRGFQIRRVKCVDRRDKKIQRDQCDLKLKPKHKRRCVMKSCHPSNCGEVQKRKNSNEDGEHDLFVRGRMIRVYCKGMNTQRPREYITLKSGESDNYSVVYRKTTGPATCSQHRPVDACGCFEHSLMEAGRTTFFRIGINMTSLRVSTNDLSFSRSRGEQVPFGQSTDCYGRTRCPQSRFSLSLVGTGLRVAPETQWISQGGRPAAKIQRLENGKVVQGKCGGYCGRCVPDDKGLRLDVVPP